MKGYLSIGKVAKLKNVSIKSLRYYDRIGVLKPAYINESTNYRYYTEDQLYLLDAIGLCIELGIPLSRFESYREADGQLNIRKLLFDGKDMAEKKIRSMRDCIDQLSATLQRLESEEDRLLPGGEKEEAGALETDTAEPEVAVEQEVAAEQEAATEPDSGVPQKVIPKRLVFLKEFDEVTTARRYNHMLLSLFVNAERNGYSGGYPAGLLYRWDRGECKKYVFVTLAEADEENLSEDCLVLPEQSYYISRDTGHRIEEAEEVFAQVFDKMTPEQYMLIETDVMEEKGMRELQLLIL
ncbi:MAG: MerR family transcriptional regulator [Lachnospiraceae bacterium]|nr:MerR family transcriptional regulator [Lachnospiraceae bacterium]